MKVRIAVVAALLASLVIGLSASGQTGIYGIVEKVVLEPGDRAPERIQVWGAFALIERMLAPLSGSTQEVEGQYFTNYMYQRPTRGYLYFKLPDAPAAAANIRTEWKDLASVAGTGQAVAFGYADHYRGDKMMRIRSASSPPNDPDIYYTNVGVAKLPPTGAHASIVAELRKLLDR